MQEIEEVDGFIRGRVDNDLWISMYNLEERIHLVKPVSGNKQQLVFLNLRFFFVVVL